MNYYRKQFTQERTRSRDQNTKPHLKCRPEKFMRLYSHQMAQMVKNPPTMQETWEYPLEKEMSAHSSILAWRISWTEEPGSPWDLKESDSTEWLTQQTYIKNASSSLAEWACLDFGATLLGLLLILSYRLQQHALNELSDLYLPQSSTLNSRNGSIYYILQDHYKWIYIKLLKEVWQTVRIQLNVLIFIFIVFNIDHCTPKEEGKTKDTVANPQIYRKINFPTTIKNENWQWCWIWQNEGNRTHQSLDKYFQIGTHTS